VIGLAFGGYFLSSASSAASDSKTATNYFTVIALKDKADSRGQLGVIATVAGGALVIGGIVRYMTRGTERHTTVSGWLTPSGGGVGALGRF
jgi:hypothetical protein